MKQSEDYKDLQKKIFSHNLKIYMEENGVSQKDLIRDLKLPSATISSWVNGQRMPRMDKVQQLANYLGITKSDLLEQVVIGKFQSIEEAEAFQNQFASVMKKISLNEPLSKNEFKIVDKCMKLSLVKDGDFKQIKPITINIDAANSQLNDLLQKQGRGEKLNAEEKQQLVDFFHSEAFKNAWEHLKETTKETSKHLERLQNAYEQLNEIGQEKVIEHAELLTKIPEYQKEKEE